MSQRACDQPPRIWSVARTRQLSAALLAFALLLAPAPGAALLPDDPLFEQLWGLQNTGQVITDVNGGQSVGTAGADIGAPAAWDLTTGSSDVVVAVIDTGIDYLHEDLAASMWRNPGEVAGDGVDNDGNGWADDVHGIDVVDRDADPMDDWWHGTHVAGTTAAALGNGLGIAGVAPGARLMALRAFSYPNASTSFEGTVEGIIECLRYVIDMKANRGVNVVAVEMAWWWNENSYSNWATGRWFEFRNGDIFYQAIDEARAAGIVVVTAEGNYALNNDIRPPAQLSYPATYALPNVIGVAASDATDRPAYFSSWGPGTADLFAPGDSILSTVKTGCLFPPYTGDPVDYAVFPGTGTAVPHVAGAVALMAALYPEEGVTARVNRLRHGVDRLPAYEGLAVANGRLNLLRALAEDVPPLITGLTPPDGHRAGDLVTVTGANFGSVPGRVVLSREEGRDYRTDSFVFRFLVRHAFWRDVADVYLDDVRLGTADEVIFEDGLEAGAGAWVWGGDDWSPGGMPDAWGATDAAGHSGTGSLRTRDWFTSDVDEHRLWVRNAAPVDLSGTRGREVRLSFWVRTLQTRFDDVSLWFSADGGATWEQVAVIPQLGPVAGWHHYEFMVPDAGEAVEAEVVSWSSDAATIRLPPGALRNLTVVTATGIPSSNRGVVSSWERKARTAVLGHPGSFDAVHLGGRIYAVGSWPDATGNNSAPGVVNYDPASDTWGKPERRGFPDVGTSSAAACGGRIFIPRSAPGVGGWLEIHDPGAKTWAKSHVQPQIFSESSAVCLDGAVWIAGGNDQLVTGGSRRLYRYDIAADRWDRMADMGQRRSAFAAVAARGQIYAFGGRDGWNRFLDSAEAYDPRRDEWTALAGLPGGLRGKPAAATDGRRIYLVGGQDYGPLSGTSSTQVYDAVEQRWLDPGGTAADQTLASLDSALVYVPGWGLYNLGGSQGEPRTPHDQTLFGAVVRALTRNERLDSDRLYPQVTVLGPYGGERFPSGSRVRIHWGAPREAARFNVEYTSDGGASWASVAENVTSTAYLWQAPIPGVKPIDCLVRVTAFDEAGNLLGADTSGAPFTVEVVRLLWPLSGSSLVAGDQHTIRWRTGATRRAVARTTVLLSQDWGVTWKRVAALAGNPGRLRWTVPLPPDGDLIGNGRLRVILRDVRGRVIGRADHDREFTIYLPPEAR